MNAVKHSRTFTINQPVSLVFPLFSAEGEKKWVPGWDYENVTGTQELHEDAIFLTRNHDHAASKAIWLVKRYDPQVYRVQFYKVEPEDKVGIITISCSPKSEMETKVEVGYHYIALSERGREFVKTFSEDVYALFIADWEQLLRRYFQSEGKPGGGG